MKKIPALFALALGLSFFPALAQDAKPSAAEELYNLSNVRETMLASLTGTADSVVAQVPEPKREAVRAAFMKFGEDVANSPELKTKFVAIYAELFTEAELQELLAFYRTPIGKKFIEKMPELTQKSTKAGLEIVQEKQAAFQTELREILSDKNGS